MDKVVQQLEAADVDVAVGFRRRGRAVLVQQLLRQILYAGVGIVEAIVSILP